MDTGLFIALLNPAIALALAAAFLTLWLYQRNRFYLAALAVAYACSGIGFLLQYFILPVGFELTKALSSIAFTTAACLLAGAVVVRCRGRRPSRRSARWDWLASAPSAGSSSCSPI